MAMLDLIDNVWDFQCHINTYNLYTSTYKVNLHNDFQKSPSKTI